MLSTHLDRGAGVLWPGVGNTESALRVGLGPHSHKDLAPGEQNVVAVDEGPGVALAEVLHGDAHLLPQHCPHRGHVARPVPGPGPGPAQQRHTVHNDRRVACRVPQL